MSRAKKRNRGRVAFKRVKKDTSTVSAEVDIDRILQDIDTRSKNFQLDLNVGGDFQSPTMETPVDFSVSKNLVPLTNEPAVPDTTVGRELARISDYDVLDRERLQAKRIIHPDMDDYGVINSFREIRTRLLQKSENNNFVLMVVSIGKNMGATFTTVNLGAAFAFEGEKTALLVDCHPQKTNLSSLLNLGQTVGLSDYINDPEMEINQIIYPTGINRMRLIPFGSSRDGRLEFLSSERMQEFVGALKRRYTDRFIIINAPPLEASADAAILSDIADYILITIPYGRIANNRLKKAIKPLPQKKIAGVVMNDCKRYV